MVVLLAEFQNGYGFKPSHPTNQNATENLLQLGGSMSL
jgi:hypothetical protein